MVVAKFNEATDESKEDSFHLGYAFAIAAVIHPKQFDIAAYLFQSLRTSGMRRRCLLFAMDHRAFPIELARMTLKPGVDIGKISDLLFLALRKHKDPRRYRILTSDGIEDADPEDDDDNDDDGNHKSSSSSSSSTTSTTSSSHPSSSKEPELMIDDEVVKLLADMAVAMPGERGKDELSRLLLYCALHERVDLAKWLILFKGATDKVTAMPRFVFEEDCVGSAGRISYPLAQHCPVSLMVATCYGNVELVRILASLSGTDLNAKEGLVLQMAVSSGNMEVVNLLLTLGAREMAISEFTLRKAAALGDLSVVKELVETHGVNPNAQDHLALQVAVLFSRVEVVKYLGPLCKDQQCKDNLLQMAVKCKASSDCLRALASL